MNEWILLQHSVSKWKRLHSHAGSDKAVCEDLRELRDEAEGVRLWLKRSSASFRLAVLSWDSEPESCECCKGDREELWQSATSPLGISCANRTESGTKDSPCLLWFQGATLLCPVLAAAPLLLRHNCEAKTQTVNLDVCDMVGLSALQWYLNSLSDIK